MAKNSRARGRNQAIAGKIKQGFGKITGDKQMQAAGALDVIQGEADESAVKASERATGAIQELSGTIKRVVGDMMDSSEMSVEGRVEATKGKRRQEVNQ
jgi:uncharacterized protein YjbJ (UPF0337 family)